MWGREPVPNDFGDDWNLVHLGSLQPLSSKLANPALPSSCSDSLSVCLVNYLLFGLYSSIPLKCPGEKKHWKSLGIGKKGYLLSRGNLKFTEVYISPASQVKRRLIPYFHKFRSQMFYIDFGSNFFSLFFGINRKYLQSGSFFSQACLAALPTGVAVISGSFSS